MRRGKVNYRAFGNNRRQWGAKEKNKIARVFKLIWRAEETGLGDSHREMKLFPYGTSWNKNNHNNHHSSFTHKNPSFLQFPRAPTWLGSEGWSPQAGMHGSDLTGEDSLSQVNPGVSSCKAWGESSAGAPGREEMGRMEGWGWWWGGGSQHPSPPGEPLMDCCVHRRDKSKQQGVPRLLLKNAMTRLKARQPRGLYQDILLSLLFIPVKWLQHSVHEVCMRVQGLGGINHFRELKSFILK